IMSVLKAHSIEEFGDLLSHSGEEFIYVVSGVIEVHTGGYEHLRLEAGEGVYIDSTMPHAYVSASEEDAVVLGMCSSPETAAVAVDGKIQSTDAVPALRLARKSG
ncbi:MAG: cupin domain-containing protein, partial [Pseudomonadota bacterium]